jgi:hypothetical protein
LADATARVLDAIADGLLVHIESDVIHMSFEEPPRLWSESTWPLSSALCTPRAPLGLSIQTVSRWFCPVFRVAGMTSAHSWRTMLIRDVVSRSKVGMLCFAS